MPAVLESFGMDAFFSGHSTFTRTPGAAKAAKKVLKVKKEGMERVHAHVQLIG
ncbi:hypothetical protein LZ24_00518 [Desulfobotulus alkaliphilus]|uniref:Uncharacterized protein n=1 Tax=Desulfobotulus alkaliphilus TaxID=622671 RepID=A0A562S8Y5_9BACT|nr:hypothetical protein LZ24_00518 [Desulfobotulus alkaliphilus]